MKNQTKGCILLLITTLIWGCTFVAQDLAMEIMGPCAFQAARSIIGSAVLIPVILLVDGLAKKKGTYRTPDKKEWITLLIGGIVCGFLLCVASCLQTKGIELGTTAGKAGFITTMYIIFVPLIRLFTGKRIAPHVWLCVVLACVGLFLLCIDGNAGFAVGDIIVLICAAAFALQILAVDHFVPHVDCIKLSALQFFFSGIFSLIFMVMFEGAAEITKAPLAIGPILFAGVMSCGIAYTLQIVGQKYTEPTIASLIMSFEAFFATVSGALLLPDGMMSAREFVGCGIMLVAVILSQFNFGNKKKEISS